MVLAGWCNSFTFICFSFIKASMIFSLYSSHKENTQLRLQKSQACTSATQNFHVLPWSAMHLSRFLFTSSESETCFFICSKMLWRQFSWAEGQQRKTSWLVFKIRHKPKASKYLEKLNIYQQSLQKSFSFLTPLITFH